MSKFYPHNQSVPTTIDDMIRGEHDNYKQYLKAKRKKALELKSKEDLDFVNREYAFRRKISELLKKHNCISVFFEGDDEGGFLGGVYTTWVYGEYDEDDSNDPYHDEHYCDSYEEAYDRCIEYINLEKEKEK